MPVPQLKKGIEFEGKYKIEELTWEHKSSIPIKKYKRAGDDLEVAVASITLKMSAHGMNINHLNMFNGPMLKIVQASVGEITPAELARQLKGKSIPVDVSNEYNPDNPQYYNHLAITLNGINTDSSLTDEQKGEAFVKALKQNYIENAGRAYLKVQEEKKRISDKYLGGADMNERVRISIPSDSAGTIYDPDYYALREEDRKYSSSGNMRRLTIGRGSFSPTHKPFIVHERHDLINTTRVINEIGKLEGNILSPTEPSTDKPTSPGPVSLDHDGWRDSMSFFKDTQASFIKQNQLLYTSLGDYNQGSKAPISKFVSFPNSGTPGSTSTPTSSIQTNMEYLCMWCNEHRKKILVQDAEQDPILNEMQVAQPIIR